MRSLSGLAWSIGCPLILVLASPPAQAQTPTSSANAAKQPPPAASSAPKQTASSVVPATAPSAASVPANPRTTNPHAAGSSGTEPSLADRRALNAALVSGSPYTAAAQRRQAQLARSGRAFQPQSTAQGAKMVPPGTIAVLVSDGDGAPLSDRKVTLRVTRQSIATGDQLSEQEVTTNGDGLARFEKLKNETAFRYEAVIEEGGATYPSGAFRLSREFGHIVKLVVYPSTNDIDDTFIVSRALYVVEPRAEVFQIQCMFRIHNTNPKTWVPGGLDIQLPNDWQAFSPGEASGDLRIRQTENRVIIDGSFTPGQHDFSFGFQLPNKHTETAHLTFPTPPHLVDARVFLTASPEMSLLVEGFEASEPTRGNDGRHALLTSKDFLGNTKAPPPAIHASISGLPSSGWGPRLAYGSAFLIGLLGLVLSTTQKQGKGSKLAGEDLARAKDLLLDELVTLEASFANQEIGPKTYAQTRALLLDSLARLEAAN